MSKGQVGLSFILLSAFLSLSVYPDERHAVATQRFSAPEEVKFTSKKVLFVTHNCSYWDDKCTAKPAADLTVDYAKKHGYNIVYLQHQLNDPTYYCENKSPDYIVDSFAGELPFKVPALDIVSTGGYFRSCHSTTMSYFLRSWSQSHEDVSITLIAPAIYTNVKNATYYPGLEPLDEQGWSDLKMKLKTVAASVVGTKNGALPLSTFLNLFPSDEAAAKYLIYTSMGRGVQGSLPNHKMVFKYKGITKVIQDPGKTDTPVFTITVINPSEVSQIIGELEKMNREKAVDTLVAPKKNH